MSGALKIGFLLGAGVSLPRGAPCTETLTSELLVDELPYARHTSGVYYPRNDELSEFALGGFPDSSLLTRFLQCLKRHTKSYYDSRIQLHGCYARKANYEDLAYLAIQVSESIMQERDNPALVSFIREVSCELNVSEELLQTVADEASCLIVDHVSRRLRGLSSTSVHLACIQSACHAAARDIPIISLNHDCLVEETFREAKLDINDMTRVLDDGRRILEVHPSSSGANLFKLHGSIDWFQWRSVTGPEQDRPWRHWIGSLPSDNGQDKWEAEPRPAILVGRFNKELSYAGWPFAELMAAARYSLKTLSRLFVSGYSFGDKAVNTMIIDWLHAAPKGARRIIVAHENPEQLQRDARGAIGNKWTAWQDAGVLIIVRKFLGDLSWEELRDTIKI